MEEFQCIDVILDLNDRAVEGERVVNNLLERLCIDVLSEEDVGNGIGYLLARPLTTALCRSAIGAFPFVL